MFVFLMFFENFARSLGDRAGDPGQFRHFNPIAAIRGARFDGSQKDDAILGFFYGNVLVLDPRQEVG